MRWECTECGGQVARHRSPMVCPFCGIAGALFVPTGSDPEDGVLDGSFREAWFDYGIRFTGRTTADTPLIGIEMAA